MIKRRRAKISLLNIENEYQKNYWPLKISLLKQQEDKKVQLEIQLF